jgi:phosphohistidine phosphatase
VTKTVILLRHGKSRWDQEGVEDHDRGLTGRGKRDTTRMGEELRARGLLPDVILCSTAKRARRSAMRAAKAMAYEGPLHPEAALYFHGVGQYVEALANLPDDVQRPMIVGHNPLLEELAHLLCGQAVALPTAALLCINLPIAHWTELGQSVPGTLRLLLTPRELGG